MPNAQATSRPNSQTYVSIPSVAPRPARLPIAVTITHPSTSSGFVSGFVHLWAVYVRGFNHEQHCQKALKGHLSSSVKTKSTPLSTRLLLGELETYDSLYICGVAHGPVTARRSNNLHLPLEPRSGNDLVQWTYNGYLLHIENAVILPTPELPAGWNGLPDAYTRCRNFRFCVHRFGYPPASQRRRCVTSFGA
jgi:hypothetical protein